MYSILIQAILFAVFALQTSSTPVPPGAPSTNPHQDDPIPGGICTLTLDKQIDAALSAGSTPASYVQGELSYASGNQATPGTLIESCNSGQLEGNFKMAASVTHLPADINIKISGVVGVGKRLSGYVDWTYNGKASHVDFADCNDYGNSYSGYAISDGIQCIIACDAPRSMPVVDPMHLPDCGAHG